jgi:hypothetical protein
MPTGKILKSPLVEEILVNMIEETLVQWSVTRHSH